MSIVDNREPTLYWVCVDCHLDHHGLRESEEEPDRPTLSLIPEDAEVTAGMLWEEHEEECANRKAEEWVEECDCERITFTWRSCDGCGSTLGGEREALTVWTLIEEAA